MFYNLSALRFCSAAQRSRDKTFLADHHTVKESVWLFPSTAVRSAGLVGIVEHAHGSGIQAQLNSQPVAILHLISASVVYLSYYLCFPVSSLKAGFSSKALLCPVSRQVRALHMIAAQ